MIGYDHPDAERWVGGGGPGGGPPLGGNPPSDPGGHGRGAGRGPGRWRLALALLLTAGLSAGLTGGIVAASERHAHAAQASGPVVSSAAAPAAATSSNTQAVLAKVEPSVVEISTTVGGGGPFGVVGAGAGTGIIIGSSGEVVTNAHVVSGATSIRVQVPGRGGTVAATVIGANSSQDLALLQLKGVSGLSAAAFAATSTVHVGEPVFAVGNAEGYGGAPTVTEGIVSALNRDLPSGAGGSGALHGLLQTDAAINPGNSGGALVDTAGRVIGITTEIAAGQGNEPAQNIGFAIPTDTVVKALPGLRAGSGATPSAGGSQSATGTAFLGVALAGTGPSGN
jgi:putative serine protease PepD